MSQSVTIRGTPVEVQERMVKLFAKKPLGSLICLSMTAPIACDLHCFYQGIRGDEGRQFCVFRTLVGECIAAGILLPRGVAGIELPYPPNAPGLIEVTVTVETMAEFAWADAALSNHRCNPWELLTLAQFSERTAELKEISDKFAERLDEVQVQARARSEAHCEDVEQLRSDIAQLQGSLAVVIAERDAFRFQLGGANEHIAHMRNSLAETSTRSLIAQAAPSSEPSTAVILLQQRLEDTLRELDEAAQLGLSQAQEIAALRKQVYDREAKLTTVTADLRAKDSLAAAWENKCNTANAAIATLNERLAARSEVSYSPPPRTRDASLDQELARAEKTIITQRERIEASERNAERALQAKRAAESRAEDRVAHLEAERRAAEKRVDEFTAQLETAKRELKIKRDSLDTLETEVRTLRSQVQQLRADRDAERPAERQDTGEVRRLRDEVDELKRQLITADATKLAAKRALEDETAASDKARAKANDLLKQLASVQGDHDALARKYRHLEDDLAEARASLDIRRQADDATRTVPKPRVTLAADSEPERAKLKKRIEELEQHSDRLEADLHRALRGDRGADDEASAASGDFVYLCDTAAATQTSLGPIINISATQLRFMEEIGRRLTAGVEVAEADRTAFFNYRTTRGATTRYRDVQPWHLPDWPAIASGQTTAAARAAAVIASFRDVPLWGDISRLQLVPELRHLATAFFNTALARDLEDTDVTRMFCVFERALAYIHARARQSTDDDLTPVFESESQTRICDRIQAMKKKTPPTHGGGGGRGGGGGGGRGGGGGGGRGKGGGSPGSAGSSPGLSSSLSSVTPSKQGNGKGGGQSA